MQPQPSCSVVVMGYRDAATIERGLRSILAQQTDEPFEVVVVTSGGDETELVVHRTFPEVPVIVSPTRLLPGGTRNLGVARTQGAVVAFLEADCVAEPGWIAARMAAHKLGWAAVASAMTNGDRRSLAAWAYHFDLYCTRLPSRGAGPTSFPDPACHGLSFSRALLDQLGPFDDSVRLGEDTDMARRMSRAGVTGWFEPAVRTAHFGPRATMGMVRDRAERGAQIATLDATAIPTSVRSAVGIWSVRVRATLQNAWKNAGRDRGWLIASAPWIAIGRAAGLAGAWRVGRQR